jgi:hypothetical protein
VASEQTILIVKIVNLPDTNGKEAVIDGVEAEVRIVIERGFLSQNINFLIPKDIIVKETIKQRKKLRAGKQEKKMNGKMRNYIVVENLINIFITETERSDFFPTNALQCQYIYSVLLSRPPIFVFICILVLLGEFLLQI